MAFNYCWCGGNCCCCCLWSLCSTILLVDHPVLLLVLLLLLLLLMVALFNYFSIRSFGVGVVADTTFVVVDGHSVQLFYW